jgi:hypothetical protein
MQIHGPESAWRAQYWIFVRITCGLWLHALCRARSCEVMCLQVRAHSRANSFLPALYYEVRTQDSINLVDLLIRLADIWSKAIEGAMSTVHIITSLDHTSDNYRFHQAQMMHFLVAALDILIFTTACPSSISMPHELSCKARRSLETALKQLQDAANSSQQASNVWERLKGITSRLGVLPDNNNGTRTQAMLLDSAQTNTHPEVAPKSLHNQSDFTLPLDDMSWTYPLPLNGVDFDYSLDVSSTSYMI